MLKKLLKVFLWIVAILLVAVIALYLTVGLWIKPVVHSVGSRFVQSSVSLENADISLFSGRLALKGLKVANPTGFKEPYAFTLGEISVKFQPKTVFSNKIIVDQVLIKGTQIVAETNQRAQVNLMVLNDNVQSSLNQSKSTTAPTTSAQQTNAKRSEGKAVVIKDLQIVDTSLRFAIMGQTATFSLPNIQQKNIGEKKKSTMGEVVQNIMNTLTVESMQEMAKGGQRALSNAFKVIEKHTKDNKSVQKLKDALSGFNPF